MVEIRESEGRGVRLRSGHVEIRKGREVGGKEERERREWKRRKRAIVCMRDGEGARARVCDEREKRRSEKKKKRDGS